MVHFVLMFLLLDFLSRIPLVYKCKCPFITLDLSNLNAL